MKLQQLGVIFIIIVIPISLVLSEYISVNRAVVDEQARYDNILLSSTYDAVRAFQMNTLNNGYSTVNDSKIRDISASVNSFFNSLATGLGSSGYSMEDLQGYIPAILFTMYDGYYLYGNYENIVKIKDGEQQFLTSDENLQSINGVKPYIYYTCEYYVPGTKFDIIVNYTLDNYITVMGTDSAGIYINKSGYLISTNSSSGVIKNADEIISHGIKITGEQLGEYLTIVDSIEEEARDPSTGYKTTKSYMKVYNGGQPKYYNYVYYNHQKYYFDTSLPPDINNIKSYNGINIFRLNNNLRTYLNENEAKGLANYLGVDYNALVNFNSNSYVMVDNSAYKYYDNALVFSNYIQNLFSSVSGIKVKTDSFNNSLKYTTANNTETPIHTRYDYIDENGTLKKNVFDISDEENDPEAEDSLFNEHRMDVIISSIETNLLSIIANFNIHYNSGFEFSLPVISEDEWYKITNNITVVTFMQGLPVGNYKYYSNYCVVANTKNKEFVSRNSILIRENETGNYVSEINGEYHDPKCLKLNTSSASSLMGYNNVDYEQQLVSFDVEINSTKTNYTYYYYPHTGSGSYECIIGKDEVKFSSDNILKGNELRDTEGNIVKDSSGNIIKPNDKVRKAYIEALAREKYNLYKVSDYFNTL